VVSKIGVKKDLLTETEVVVVETEPEAEELGVVRWKTGKRIIERHN
jgi:hypothetical protein